MEPTYLHDTGPVTSVDLILVPNQNPIFEDPEFCDLTKQRRILSRNVTALMLLVNFGLILSMAYMPAHTGRQSDNGEPIAWGTFFGFGMLAFTILLVTIYVWRANTCFPPKIKEIIRKLLS